MCLMRVLQHAQVFRSTRCVGCKLFMFGLLGLVHYHDATAHPAVLHELGMLLFIFNALHFM